MEKNLLVLLNEKEKKYSVELCSIKNLELDSLPVDVLFYSVTWHHSHSTNQINNPALIIAKNLAKQGKNVLLHLPCRYLSKQNVCDVLSDAKNYGIKNIFALQGEYVETEKSIDFKYAIDLVRFIKIKYGNYFTICVAGYPSNSDDLNNLKKKVDAGADFIITQMFFNINTFHEFYKNCRATGINVPILPGVYVINSYDSFKKLIKICRVHVPEKILNDVESMKNNKVALRNYGVCQATEFVNNLWTDLVYPVNTIHLFSLNDVDTILLINNMIL